MKKKLTLFFSDAKLRRISADSKKNFQFFSNLCGQTPDLWTNRRNELKICPKHKNCEKIVTVSERKRTYTLS